MTIDNLGRESSVPVHVDYVFDIESDVTASFMVSIYKGENDPEGASTLRIGRSVENGASGGVRHGHITPQFASNIEMVKLFAVHPTKGSVTEPDRKEMFYILLRIRRPEVLMTTLDHKGRKTDVYSGDAEHYYALVQCTTTKAGKIYTQKIDYVPGDRGFVNLLSFREARLVLNTEETTDNQTFSFES